MRTYLSYAITRPARGRILVGIVIWSCWILLQQFALGQGKIERHPQSLNHVAPRLPQASKPGDPISSSCSDPLMSDAVEQELFEILLRHDSTDFSGFRLVDLRDYLGSLAPIRLNRTELELIGIDPQSKLATSAKVTDGPLLARLHGLLTPLDLCVEVRSSHLEITSFDAAKSQPAVRLYDVSPLVTTGNPKYALDSLHNLICQTIAPDSWMIAGGNHTAIPFVIDGAGVVRVVLVVAATTQVHFEVQQLLNQLNSLTSSNLVSSSGLNTSGRGIAYPTPPVEHAPERFDDRVHYPRGY